MRPGTTFTLIALALMLLIAGIVFVIQLLSVS